MAILYPEHTTSLARTLGLAQDQGRCAPVHVVGDRFRFLDPLVDPPGPLVGLEPLERVEEAQHARLAVGRECGGRAARVERGRRHV